MTGTLPRSQATRPRWQFSLRSLLALVLTANLGLGLRECLRDERREAYVAITKAGGRFEGKRTSCLYVDLVKHDGVVEHIRLGKVQRVTPGFLDHLKQFPECRSLTIRECDVTDRALAHLKGLDRLEFLSLIDNQGLTDGSLEILERLPHLQSLELSDLPIGDAAMAHVGNSRHLQTLFLDNVQITDVGLEHVKRLAQLRGLFLTNTMVSEAAVRRLAKRLPACEIVCMSDEERPASFTLLLGPDD